MTRKMSRYGAMILAVVLLVGLSCSVAAQKKVTIVHWQHHSPARFEVVQTFAEEFMKQNPNVRIEIESVPESDYFQNCSPHLRLDPGPTRSRSRRAGARIRRFRRNPAYRHSRGYRAADRGRVHSACNQETEAGRKVLRFPCRHTDDCPVLQPRTLRSRRA